MLSDSLLIRQKNLYIRPTFLELATIISLIKLLTLARGWGIVRLDTDEFSPGACNMVVGLEVRRVIRTGH